MTHIIQKNTGGLFFPKKSFFPKNRFFFCKKLQKISTGSFLGPKFFSPAGRTWGGSLHQKKIKKIKIKIKKIKINERKKTPVTFKKTFFFTKKSPTSFFFKKKTKNTGWQNSPS